MRGLLGRTDSAVGDEEALRQTPKVETQHKSPLKQELSHQPFLVLLYHTGFKALGYQTFCLEFRQYNYAFGLVQPSNILYEDYYIF